MADFDLSKITGREPPLVTDDERDAEIAYLSDVVANRDRELAALRARVEQYQRALEVLYSDESGDLDYIKWYITEKVLTIEARNAIDAGGLSGNKTEVLK